MTMRPRTRVDAWDISRGSKESAAELPWHPVLVGYARGVEKMMELDKNRPPTVKSWMWAAHTHGFPEDVARLSTSWATCKHASPFFLPWHRAYLVWFEMTIQEMINDDSWALPYWDYTGNDPARLNPPPEFEVPTYKIDGTVIRNPLYVADRGFVLPESLNGDLGSVDRSMAEYRYVRKNKRTGFGGSDVEHVTGYQTVEWFPHNNVHMDVGGETGLMGSPTTAAQDPVFWVHHANIDRMWCAWRELEGSLDADLPGGLVGEVALDWASEDFTFGSNNGPVVFHAIDMTNLAAPNLNYSYDKVSLPTDQHPHVMELRAAIIESDQIGVGSMGLDEFDPDDLWNVAGASDAPFTVGDAGFSVEVPIETVQLNLTGDVAPPSGLSISLDGVQADAKPYSFYRVSVAASGDAPSHDLGSFPTFGIGPGQEFPRTLTFDASTLIHQLVDDGWAGGPLVVRVVPDLERANVTPGGAEADLAIEQVTVTQRP